MPTTKSGLLFSNDELLCKNLGLPYTPHVSLSSDTLQCSFCGDEVDLNRATHGMLKPRKIDGGLVKTYDQSGNVVDFETKILHVADRKIACPNCVGMLKPLYKRCTACKGKTPLEISKCPSCKGTKEGELMHNGIEFPQSEG